MGCGSVEKPYEKVYRQSIEQPEDFWGKSVKRISETVEESTKGIRIRGLCCSVVVIYKKIPGEKFLRHRKPKKQNGVVGLGQGILARLVPASTNTFKIDEAVVRVGC